MCTRESVGGTQKKKERKILVFIGLFASFPPKQAAPSFHFFSALVMNVCVVVHRPQCTRISSERREEKVTKPATAQTLTLFSTQKYNVKKNTRKKEIPPLRHKKKPKTPYNTSLNSVPVFDAAERSWYTQAGERSSSKYAREINSLYEGKREEERVEIKIRTKQGKAKKRGTVENTRIVRWLIDREGGTDIEMKEHASTREGQRVRG